MRTLLDGDNRPVRRTAMVAQALAAYDVDVAALSETRLAGEGSLTEVGQGYTFYWRGVPEGRARIHGVGFALKNDLVKSLTELPIGHSERLMSLRLPLARSKHMTIISAYAPTLVADDDVKDEFYCALTQLLQSVKPEDKLVLMGDFNARVGTDAEVWNGILGPHGTGNMNSNGLRLLSLCSEFDLTITNTRFQIKNIHKNTWRHPRSGHLHMIDHIITRKRDFSECLVTRVMRGAECGTDHLMQRMILRAAVRPPVRKTGVKSRKLNTAVLQTDRGVEQLGSTISTMLYDQEPIAEPTTSSPSAITREWTVLSKKLYLASTQVLGFRRKKHRDWFDENNEELTRLINEKNRAHNNYLSRRSLANKQRWKDLQQHVQRTTRDLRNTWWEQQARDIQACADEGRVQAFYEGIKRVSGPLSNNICPIKDADGTTLLKDNDRILKRWAGYYTQLLNSSNPTDPGVLDELPRLPPVHEMDRVPTIQEVRDAVKSLKCGKAPGPDGIPAEIFKCGGEDLLRHLTAFFQKCWSAGEVPQQWLHAIVANIYKRKGERSECGNYRGLSLLDVAGKIFAKIMASRFNRDIAERLLPDSQCGFRADRSTSDSIFVCRQLLEKGREQRQPVSIAFVDLKKAFDTVDRSLLFSILERFGCPPVFLGLLRAMHSGNTAAVRVGGNLSDTFDVTMGVKQGCVLAPVLFNVFLLAVTLLSTRSAESRGRSAGIRVRYRCDGGAFRLARLKARGRTQQMVVRDLQYADDAAILARDSRELQEELALTDAQYGRLGLEMNTSKTEVMHRVAGEASPEALTVIRGSNIREVQEFTYLGSIISSNCTLDREISNRMSRASAAFGQLKDRVYLNRNLKLATKIKVYHAIVISILLYGCETWTVYSKQLKLLNTFHLRCLRKMLNITWQDKVPNNDVLSRCNCKSMYSIVAERTLRWAGLMQRMPAEMLPKAVFYSELVEGTRPVGRPRKRYKDYLQDTLKKCCINPNNFETLAGDRPAWRQAVRVGTNQYEESIREKSDQLRQARHNQQRGEPRSGTFLCQEQGCGRGFRTAAGLSNHTRAHQRALQRQQRGRSRLRIEGLP